MAFSFRIPKPSWKHSIAIAIATVGFMLPWQFAQFALMTQVLQYNRLLCQIWHFHISTSFFNFVLFQLSFTILTCQNVNILSVLKKWRVHISSLKHHSWILILIYNLCASPILKFMYLNLKCFMCTEWHEKKRFDVFTICVIVTFTSKEGVNMKLSMLRAIILFPINW